MSLEKIGEGAQKKEKKDKARFENGLLKWLEKGCEYTRINPNCIDSSTLLNCARFSSQFLAFTADNPICDEYDKYDKRLQHERNI